MEKYSHFLSPQKDLIRLVSRLDVWTGEPWASCGCVQGLLLFMCSAGFADGRSGCSGPTLSGWSHLLVMPQRKGSVYQHTPGGCGQYVGAPNAWDNVLRSRVDQVHSSATLPLVCTIQPYRLMQELNLNESLASCNSRSFMLNLLKPNDIYICRTAALTSRRYISYIYSTNIHTEYFKHAA